MAISLPSSVRFHRCKTSQPVCAFFALCPIFLPRRSVPSHLQPFRPAPPFQFFRSAPSLLWGLSFSFFVFRKMCARVVRAQSWQGGPLRAPVASPRQAVPSGIEPNSTAATSGRCIAGQGASLLPDTPLRGRLRSPSTHRARSLHAPCNPDEGLSRPSTTMSLSMMRLIMARTDTASRYFGLFYRQQPTTVVAPFKLRPAPM
jgi:hypothetical protein